MRDRERESEKDRNTERESERERVTMRRDVMFSGEKKQHKKAQTENIDDLLVTTFLCVSQRCLFLRRAGGRLVADAVS